MNKTFTILAFSALMIAPAMAQSADANSQSLSQSGAIVVQNSTTTRQAPGAYAPGLAAAGVETCTASASSGVSGPGFGISFGATSIDEGCEARLDARILAGVGLGGAAVQRLCERPKMAIAMYNSGQFICPQYAERYAADPVSQSTRQVAPAAKPQRVTSKPTGRRYDADTNSWVAQ